MQTTVIKIGGTLVSDDASLDALWSAVRRLGASRHVVVVHGGGARATELAERLGHTPRMIHGRRVTTDLDLQIVQWTMRGELNSRLVARAAAHDVEAVGISGADGSVLRVEKRPPWQIDDETIDFGWVGDVKAVRTRLLDVLLNAGFTPVVAPVGIDDTGLLYNVNADTVSCAVAGALEADEYLLITEAGGVRRQVDDASTHLETCDAELFERGQREGWIAGGMLVKLKVAFDALQRGVTNVFIAGPDFVIDRSTGTRITH